MFLFIVIPVIYLIRSLLAAVTFQWTAAKIMRNSKKYRIVRTMFVVPLKLVLNRYMCMLCVSEATMENACVYLKKEFHRS